MIPVVSSAPGKVLSFTRFDDQGGVFAVFNLSSEPQTVSFRDSLHHGRYTEYFTQSPATFSSDSTLDLPAWSYRVFRKDGQT
jgi:hypothetical protein